MQRSSVRMVAMPEAYGHTDFIVLGGVVGGTGGVPLTGSGAGGEF